MYNILHGFEVQSYGTYGFYAELNDYNNIPAVLILNARITTILRKFLLLNYKTNGV